MAPHYERTVETLEGRAPRYGPLGVIATHTGTIFITLGHQTIPSGGMHY